MEKYFNNINLSTFDPKSRLQEWCVKHKKLPEYKLIKKDGPDHQPRFKIKVIIDPLTFHRRMAIVSKMPANYR